MLRRRSEADAFAKAQEVEAEAVKLLPRVRESKYVKKWVDVGLWQIRNNFRCSYCSYHQAAEYHHPNRYFHQRPVNILANAPVRP